jgi:serine/threonine protein kinase
VHPLIGKTAAIKILNRQYSSNPQMVSRFIAEARAVNQIRHRNIIDIFAFGALPDGRQYFLMELLEGTPFDRWLEHNGRMAPEQAIPLLRGVARALDAAHAKGIAHRDLKPENVYLVFDEDGGVEPKLLDFGIAKLMSDGASAHKTRTGTPMGTPFYMSPEQARGQNVDHRTDIYSFGVLCHQVLTGKLPFDGEAVMDILVKHMTAPAPLASDDCPELGPAFDAAIVRMLEKDADKRPRTVSAALDELQDAAQRAGFNVPAVPVTKGSVLSGSMPGPPTSSTRSTPGAPVTPSAAQSTPASRQLTPSIVAEMGHAKTMAHADVSARTLTPAESDVAPPAQRRTALFVAVAVGILAVGGAVGFLATRSRATTSALGSSESASATTAADPSSTTRTSSAATATAALSASAIASDPREIEVTFQATPAKAAIFQGAKKLGDAPGPIRLAFGHEKVTLTIRAPGYQDEKVDITPTANAIVPVTLPLLKSPQGPARPNVPKDLEPF